MQPYEDYIEQFNEALISLLDIAPTIESVDDLESELDEERFVKAFRALMRLKNSLGCYADFSFADLESDCRRASGAAWPLTTLTSGSFASASAQ